MKTLGNLSFKYNDDKKLKFCSKPNNCKEFFGLKYFGKSIKYLNISFFKVNLDKEISNRTENIFKKIYLKEDIINLKLPHGIPGSFLYDSILKRQRCATVNVSDENLKEHIYKFLYSIKFAENLIDSCKPEIVILSHCISFQCTPMAWIASKKNIPPL